MKTEPVLKIVGQYEFAHKNTDRAVAWNALVAMQGHARPTVLLILTIAEESWHRGAGRTVQGIDPTSWLRRFADFIEWVEQ